MLSKGLRTLSIFMTFGGAIVSTSLAQDTKHVCNTGDTDGTCEYWCNDQSCINTAIQACSTSVLDTVKLHAGTWTISAPIVIDRAIKFQGLGPSQSILSLSNDAPCYYPGGSCYGTEEYTSGVTVRCLDNASTHLDGAILKDFRITGGRYFSQQLKLESKDDVKTVTNAQLQNIEFDHQEYLGDYIPEPYALFAKDPVLNVQVKDCIFHHITGTKNATIEAIKLQGDDDMYVHNCLAYMIGGGGFSIGGTKAGNIKNSIAVVTGSPFSNGCHLKDHDGPEVNQVKNNWALLYTNALGGKGNHWSNPAVGLYNNTIVYALYSALPTRAGTNCSCDGSYASWEPYDYKVGNNVVAHAAYRLSKLGDDGTDGDETESDCHDEVFATACSEYLGDDDPAACETEMEANYYITGNDYCYSGNDQATANGFSSVADSTCDVDDALTGKLKLVNSSGGNCTWSATSDLPGAGTTVGAADLSQVTPYLPCLEIYFPTSASASYSDPDADVSSTINKSVCDCGDESAPCETLGGPWPWDVDLAVEFDLGASKRVDSVMMSALWSKEIKVQYRNSLFSSWGDFGTGWGTADDEAYLEPIVVESDSGLVCARYFRIELEQQWDNDDNPNTMPLPTPYIMEFIALKIEEWIAPGGSPSCENASCS